MTITREMLVEAMQPVNGRVPTLKELGYKFGVTKQAIQQWLAKRGLCKPSSFSGTHCSTCGSRRNFNKNGERTVCRKCNPPKVYHLVCGECGGDFSLSQTKMTHRIRHHNPTNPGKPRRAPYFCSPRCSGKWIGRHHGFGAHPDNARGRQLARSYAQLCGHPNINEGVPR